LHRWDVPDVVILGRELLARNDDRFPRRAFGVTLAGNVLEVSLRR
jgi:hypothetical protein